MKLQGPDKSLDIPGNVLGRAERKMWAAYATFHDLGHLALCREDCWLSVNLERSSFASQLPGGIGQILARSLWLQFAIS